MNNIKKCNCIKCIAPRWKLVNVRFETVGCHLYKVITLKLGNNERVIRSLLK